MNKFLMLILIAALCAAGTVQAELVGAWKLDETSGTVAADSSGNGYDAEIVSVGTGVDVGVVGVYGNALHFNGDDAQGSGLNIPVGVWNDSITGSQMYSFCFWYKLDDPAQEHCAFGSNPNRHFQAHMPWDGGSVYFDTEGDRPTTAWQDEWTGEWALWTFQQDTVTGLKRLYRNDELLMDLTGRTTALSDRTQIIVGAKHGYANPTIASFDEIRFYDHVLSVEEIQDVMAGKGVIVTMAHTPTPANGGTVTAIQVQDGVDDPNWLSPLQSDDVDPNFISVDGYDVWWSIGQEPNFIDDTPTFTTAQSYTPAEAIDYETTYYWRVDTHVTWDSNEITGNFTDVIEGTLWSFTTEPSYTAPVIDAFDSVVTTVDIGTADMEVVVSGNSAPIASVVFELLTDDAQFPADSDAVLSDNGGIDMTTTLSTSVAGTYKVKVTVIDAPPSGDATTVEAIAEVAVYADACEAKKASPSGWTASYYDRDEDCDVDIDDLSEFTLEWLEDTYMVEQEVDDLDVVEYVPQAVYDARIDAVSDIMDPNSCSNPPITDTTGIVIETTRVNATDSTNLGSAASGEWVEYEVTLDAGTYDVYVGYSCSSGTGQELSFGIDGEPAKYGTVFLSATGSWDTFWGIPAGKITLTESGTQTIRTTYGGYSNVDWFAFDPQ